MDEGRCALTVPVHLPDPLSGLTGMLGATLEQVRACQPVTEAQIDRDVRFRQLDGAIVLRDLPGLPGVQVCLHDGVVKAIYVGRGPILSALVAEELDRALGEPEAEWPARTGAGHTQRVYPNTGVAVAGDRKTVAAIALFSPTSLAHYLVAFEHDPAPEPIR
jgi:hypothetical protein